MLNPRFREQVRSLRSNRIGVISRDRCNGMYDIEFEEGLDEQCVYLEEMEFIGRTTR